MGQSSGTKIPQTCFEHTPAIKATWFPRFNYLSWEIKIKLNLRDSRKNDYHLN